MMNYSRLREKENLDQIHDSRFDKESNKFFKKIMNCETEKKTHINNDIARKREYTL